MRSVGTFGRSVWDSLQGLPTQPESESMASLSQQPGCVKSSRPPQGDHASRKVQPISDPQNQVGACLGYCVVCVYRAAESCEKDPSFSLFGKMCDFRRKSIGQGGGLLPPTPSLRMFDWWVWSASRTHSSFSRKWWKRVLEREYMCSANEATVQHTYFFQKISTTYAETTWKIYFLYSSDMFRYAWKIIIMLWQECQTCNDRVSLGHKLRIIDGVKILLLLGDILQESTKIFMRGKSTNCSCVKTLWNSPQSTSLGRRSCMISNRPLSVVQLCITLCSSLEKICPKFDMALLTSPSILCWIWNYSAQSVFHIRSFAFCVTMGTVCLAQNRIHIWPRYISSTK